MSGRKERAELREIMLEYNAGMEAAGMGNCKATPSYPREHIEARRLWDRHPDTRCVTGRICGDPILLRSALGQREVRA